MAGNNLPVSNNKIAKKSRGTKRKKSEENFTQVIYKDIPTDEPLQKKKKKSKNRDLMKPPTVEELNNLKETENLYNNNLFRLEISVLLKKIKVKNDKKKALETWLADLQLTDLPKFDVKLSTIKESTLHKYNCNFKTDQDLILKFERPDGYQCFGLYENNCFPYSTLEIEINFTIPKSCLREKDYLNNRYLVRRFYYLSYLNKYLFGDDDSHFAYENNILLPILIIQPKHGKFIVKVYVNPPKDYFKSTRYLPHMNNVKKDLFDMQIQNNEILSKTSTVFYNSALAHDCTLTANNEHIRNILNECQNIQDGIKLICIWLKLREFNVGLGGFTETMVLHLMAYLHTKKKINKLMSSYQVVRKFWNFLISHDLETNPISFCDSTQSIDLFKNHFSLVFLNQTGDYNLMSFLNLNIYRKVIDECRTAIKLLDSSSIESFRLLFLERSPFCLQYDLYIDLTSSLALFDDQIEITDEEKSTFIGYKPFMYLSKLTDIIQTGLDKRMVHFVPQIRIQSSSVEIESILFGINLNRETAFNKIELGPDLRNFEEVEKFRQFWGHLSSNRRFKDGSVNVAVVIKAGTVRGRRSIFKRMLKYILMEKLQLKFQIYYDEVEKMLINESLISPYLLGTNEEGCIKVINVADDLGRKIRSLKLTLNIIGIQGLSDAFCYTDPCPPIACLHEWHRNIDQVAGNNLLVSLNETNSVPRFIQPIDLVLYLEYSSKWPNTLDGIKHVKTSFYLEIAKHLKEKYKITSHVTWNYFQVLYDGLVFRYALYLPKEATLMKQQITTDSGTIEQNIETNDSLEYEKKFNILPKVIGALKGLHLQHPSYGPSTALIKRWFRSMMLDEYLFPEIVINLLNASLYLNCSKFAEPCTPQIAFLRFLKFLSEFEWDIHPIVVNFNEEITKSEISDLETRFLEIRKHLQPLYIIMPFDKGQSLFTKSNPSLGGLKSAKACARYILNEYEIQFYMKERCFELEQIFYPNLNSYDVKIYLNPSMNSRKYENIGQNENELQLASYLHTKDEKIPIVGFNYVDLYLEYLRENYGYFAEFFHNSYGGNVIGVLWHSEEIANKPVKVSNTIGRKLVEKHLVFNKKAVIKDFCMLGKGLIEKIEVN